MQKIGKNVWISHHIEKKNQGGPLPLVWWRKQIFSCMPHKIFLECLVRNGHPPPMQRKLYFSFSFWWFLGLLAVLEICEFVEEICLLEKKWKVAVLSKLPAFRWWRIGCVVGAVEQWHDNVEALISLYITRRRIPGNMEYHIPKNMTYISIYVKLKIF